MKISGLIFLFAALVVFFWTFNPPVERDAPPIVLMPPAPPIPEPEPPATATPETVAEPAAAPPAPPEKHLAPDGVFYVLKRISITTDSGVIGIPVGTKVTRLKPGPPMRVTNGEREFDVQADAVTNDLDIAAQTFKLNGEQEAELTAARNAQVQLGRGDRKSTRLNSSHRT